MSSPFSLRLPPRVIDRLARRASTTGTQSRTLAQRYVEEGLRRDEHPQVWFADGPAGRRAAMAGTGPDVWEVIATVRDNAGSLPATADYLGLPLGRVEAAVAYYGAFKDEIDREIAQNEEESRNAIEALLAGRRALDG